MTRTAHKKKIVSAAASKCKPASRDRLTNDETADVLKEIQHHFVIRTSAVIDDEIDRLRILELSGERPGSAATHDFNALTEAFKDAVKLADRQYFGDLLDAEMSSSGSPVYVYEAYSSPRITWHASSMHCFIGQDLYEGAVRVMTRFPHGLPWLSSHPPLKPSQAMFY